MGTKLSWLFCGLLGVLPLSSNSATIYLVRHAEKQQVGVDPALTACGLARANALAADLAKGLDTHQDMRGAPTIGDEYWLEPCESLCGTYVLIEFTAADHLHRVPTLLSCPRCHVGTLLPCARGATESAARAGKCASLQQFGCAGPADSAS